MDVSFLDKVFYRRVLLILVSIGVFILPEAFTVAFDASLPRWKIVCLNLVSAYLFFSGAADPYKCIAHFYKKNRGADDNSKE